MMCRHTTRLKSLEYGAELFRRVCRAYKFVDVGERFLCWKAFCMYALLEMPLMVPEVGDGTLNMQFCDRAKSS